MAVMILAPIVVAKAVGIAGIPASTQLGVIGSGLLLKAGKWLWNRAPVDKTEHPGGSPINAPNTIDGTATEIKDPAAEVMQDAINSLLKPDASVLERAKTVTRPGAVPQNIEDGVAELWVVGDDNGPGLMVTGASGKRIWVPFTADELRDMSITSRRVSRLYRRGGILFVPKGRTS